MTKPYMDILIKIKLKRNFMKKIYLSAILAIFSTNILAGDINESYRKLTECDLCTPTESEEKAKSVSILHGRGIIFVGDYKSLELKKYIVDSVYYPRNGTLEKTATLLTISKSEANAFIELVRAINQFMIIGFNRVRVPGDSIYNIINNDTLTHNVIEWYQTEYWFSSWVRIALADANTELSSDLITIDNIHLPISIIFELMDGSTIKLVVINGEFVPVAFYDQYGNNVPFTENPQQTGQNYSYAFPNGTASHVIDAFEDYLLMLWNMTHSSSGTLECTWDGSRLTCRWL